MADLWSCCDSTISGLLYQTVFDADHWQCADPVLPVFQWQGYTGDQVTIAKAGFTAPNHHGVKPARFPVPVAPLYVNPCIQAFQNRQQIPRGHGAGDIAAKGGAVAYLHRAHLCCRLR